MGSWYCESEGFDEMSDIKSQAVRVHVGRGDIERQDGARSSLPAIRPSQIDLRRKAGSETQKPQIPQPSVLLSEFSAPPRETRELLANPAVTAALVAVSSELAPAGVAESPRDRYVASVVETHLAAKRQLAKHLNAMLRA